MRHFFEEHWCKVINTVNSDKVLVLGSLMFAINKGNI